MQFYIYLSRKQWNRLQIIRFSTSLLSIYQRYCTLCMPIEYNNGSGINDTLPNLFISLLPFVGFCRETIVLPLPEARQFLLPLIAHFSFSSAELSRLVPLPLCFSVLGWLQSNRSARIPKLGFMFAQILLFNNEIILLNNICQGCRIVIHYYCHRP